jgi:hypothetical protein
MTVTRNAAAAKRMRAMRRRQRAGIRRLPIDVTRAQLDQLEVRGYLDPDRRGDRAHECDAVENFLMAALAKSGSQLCGQDRIGHDRN